MRKYHSIILTLFFWAANLYSGNVTEQSPVDVLEQASQELVRLVYDTPNPTHKTLTQIVRPELEKYFDSEGMTRRAVGLPWRSFNPEQRARVTALFVELILGTYLDSFEPGAKPKIHFGETVYKNGRKPQCEVSGIIEYEGKRYNVSYRMEKGGDGWRIYDLIGEGVSLIANYRSQFDPITRHGGASALIQALEKNLSNIKGESKK